MTIYHLPPEWAKQSGVMLTWPHEENSWYPSLAEVESSFTIIATEVSKREKVLISCLHAVHQAHIEALLRAAEVDLTHIKFYVAPSNDVWARDHGPLIVTDNQNQIKLLDFKFNGWGNKYPADRDNVLTLNLHRQGAFSHNPLEQIDLVLEGGSVEVDGEGTLLTTRSCLLSPERNPTVSAENLELYLKQWFGVKRVLWLDHGFLAGDDTDGHIDTLARFINPETIAYVSCTEPQDEHFVALQAMEQQLRSFKNYRGESYKLVPLPFPAAKYGPDDRRLPATYANFLIINGAVLMPTYADPADAEALHLLQTSFIDRDVIGVPCRHVIEQYGSLHCVTMQLPMGSI